MKTLFKKSFAVFLSAVLLLSALPFTASAASILDSGTAGECTWSMDSMGTLTISGNGSMGDYNYDEAPWSGWQYQISSVVIENGVTNISDHAFLPWLLLVSDGVPSANVSSYQPIGFVRIRGDAGQI